MHAILILILILLLIIFLILIFIFILILLFSSTNLPAAQHPAQHLPNSPPKSPHRPT